MPSIFPSLRVFSAVCIRWTKYWSFSFSISPSNEYSGLISFRMDWLDLLAVQGTLKSPQYHSSKASIVWLPTGNTLRHVLSILFEVSNHCLFPRVAPTAMRLSLSSCSVMSDSLWPHGLQHARLPYPSPTPGACSNSCPSSQWCQPTISSSVIPFSSCLQSFSASRSLPKSQLCASSGQSTGASASTSVLPMNIQDWFLLAWTGWISLQSKGLSRVFSNTTVQKHQFFGAQPTLLSSSHIHTWLL